MGSNQALRGILKAAIAALAFIGCDGHDGDDYPAPAPPTDLSATAVSNAQINLAWTDNADGEHGFIMEKSSDGLNFAEAALLPPDSTSAGINGLAPSTTYFFRVRAYGYKSLSPYSNVAAATTTGLSWTLLSPTGGPPDPRAYHAAVFQPGLRMIVYGGYGASQYDDAWSLDMTMPPLAWVDITPASVPPHRDMVAATYDLHNDRMIVFGGTDEDFPNNNDVWALNLSSTPSWEKILETTPAGPSSRFGHTLVYDAANRRAILFGGTDGLERNDVWALNLSGAPAWISIMPSGTPPGPRYAHSAVYDAANQRMIVFGGYTGAQLSNETWALRLSGNIAWERLTPSAIPPSARGGHSAIYDAANQRMFVFGGDDGDIYNPIKNDLWVLTMMVSPEWRPVFTSAPSPSPRVGHSAVYGQGGMIIFGGWDNWSEFNNETWILGL